MFFFIFLYCFVRFAADVGIFLQIIDLLEGEGQVYLGFHHHWSVVSGVWFVFPFAVDWLLFRFRRVAVVELFVVEPFLHPAFSFLCRDVGRGYVTLSSPSRHWFNDFSFLCRGVGRRYVTLSSPSRHWLVAV